MSSFGPNPRATKAKYLAIRQAKHTAIKGKGAGRKMKSLEPKMKMIRGKG